MRQLTSRELKIHLDTEKGYLGSQVKGEPVLECSSLDKLMIFFGDGRYRVMPPPDTLFVDDQLSFCGKYDREAVFTAIYTEDDNTYVKRFAVGGAIMNRDYRFAPEGAKVILFEPGEPDKVYVKYRKRKKQRINQQAFDLTGLDRKGARARGKRMTTKPVDRIATEPGRWWKTDEDSPDGVLL